jgi:hypothetical protein
MATKRAPLRTTTKRKKAGYGKKFLDGLLSWAVSEPALA